MTTILFRTIVIYITLLTAMRLMGKRQIGELEISDLITTLLISEIASLPITDANIPLSHAIIPIILLLTFEVLSSALLVKIPSAKKFISTRPTTLIKNGTLLYSQMKSSRITADELISELRQQGISDLSEVNYAILEQNGKISVIPKPQFKPLTANDVGISTADPGLFHIIIENCEVNESELSTLGLDRSFIKKALKNKELSLDNVYLMLVSDGGEIQIIKKEEK